MGSWLERIPPLEALLARYAGKLPLEPVVRVAIRLQFLWLLEDGTRAHPVPHHDRVAFVWAAAQALTDLLLRLYENLAVASEPRRGFSAPDFSGQ